MSISHWHMLSNFMTQDWIRSEQSRAVCCHRTHIKPIVWLIPDPLISSSLEQGKTRSILSEENQRIRTHWKPFSGWEQVLDLSGQPLLVARMAPRIPPPYPLWAVTRGDINGRFPTHPQEESTWSEIQGWQSMQSESKSDTEQTLKTHHDHAEPHNSDQFWQPVSDHCAVHFQTLFFYCFWLVVILKWTETPKPLQTYC